MGRGRYPARLKVAPPPPELAARYLQVWPGRDLYARPELFPPLASAGLFGDDRPLELDIGCATGDLVLALASRDPVANYVGIDIVGKPLWRAVERAAGAGLSNVRFVHADIRLIYRQVPDAALRAAYLHFPAPLLRTRKRGQLLPSPTLLAAMARCLMPGGRLSFMTDQPALFEALHAMLPGAPGLQLVPADQWSVTITELLKSHYHRRWEARGRPILRTELTRIADRKAVAVGTEELPGV